MKVQRSFLFDEIKVKAALRQEAQKGFMMIEGQDLQLHMFFSVHGAMGALSGR